MFLPRAAGLCLLSLALAVTALLPRDGYAAPYLIDDDGYFWDADIGLDNGGVIAASRAQLFRHYFGALGRLPDADGFNWWATAMDEGRYDLMGVSEGFVNSEEFRNLADKNQDGAVSEEEFVDHIYRLVFGRDPDVAGFAWWVGELTGARRSTAEVFTQMTQSNEYVQLTVDAAAAYLPDGYTPIIGRPQYPTPPVGPWIAPGEKSRMPKLTFEGAWRHRKGRWNEIGQITGMKGGFAVTDDGVWLTNNRNKIKAVGKYTRPEPALTTDVAEMPMAELITPFFEVEPQHSNSTHLSDVFYDEVVDKVYITINEFYDADKDNNSFIAVMNTDGSDKRGFYDVTNRQMAAGQILKTPEHLIKKVGGRLYIHPEHWTNIISRVSTGAGLHGWDGALPSDPRGTIELTPHLYYPHTETPGEHRTAGCDQPANPIFNRLSRYEVSFFWNDSYISIGLNAGQKGGIDYGVPPYGINKGNYTCIEVDYDNYYWIWDQDDIFSAEKPWDPKPVEWGYLEPLAPEVPWIIGAYFDPESNKLYLLGKSDRLQGDEWNPVIYQYQVSD